MATKHMVLAATLMMVAVAGFCAGVMFASGDGPRPAAALANEALKDIQAKLDHLGAKLDAVESAWDRSRGEAMVRTEAPPADVGATLERILAELSALRTAQPASPPSTATQLLTVADLVHAIETQNPAGAAPAAWLSDCPLLGWTVGDVLRAYGRPQHSCIEGGLLVVEYDLDSKTSARIRFKDGYAVESHVEAPWIARERARLTGEIETLRRNLPGAESDRRESMASSLAFWERELEKLK